MRGKNPNRDVELTTETNLISVFYKAKMAAEKFQPNYDKRQSDLSMDGANARLDN